MDFGGSAVEKMSLESRLVLANMTVEMGAKAGIIEPNQTTLDYLSRKTADTMEVVRNDPCFSA